MKNDRHHETRRMSRKRLRRGSSRRPPIELLETRTLLAVTATFSAGYLRVYGDNLANDSISIAVLGTFVDVLDWATPITITGGPVAPGAVTRIVVTGENGNDTIDLKGVTTAAGFPAALSGNIELMGNNDVDVIHGSDLRDCIWGGGGNDLLSGCDGNDSIYGDVGDDHLWGEELFGFCVGTTSDDRLEGGDGNDELFGQVGNDTLWGEGSAWDTSLTGTSYDSMSGGAGDDKVYGQAGNDLLLGDDVHV